MNPVTQQKNFDNQFRGLHSSALTDGNFGVKGRRDCNEGSNGGLKRHAKSPLHRQHADHVFNGYLHQLRRKLGHNS